MSVVERETDRIKYESNNWLAQALIRNFQKKIKGLLINLDYQTLHEVGCGEGYNIKFLAKLKPADCSGSDFSLAALDIAKIQNPDLKFTHASIYQLPFPDQSFDLVVASQVLEHLHNCHQALSEIERITRKYCLLTVPAEPLWRILNLIRGAYWLNMGNPPTHFHHWTKKGFTKLINQYFIVEKTLFVLPWLIILAKKNNDVI